MQRSCDAPTRIRERHYIGERECTLFPLTEWPGLVLCKCIDLRLRHTSLARGERVPAVAECAAVDICQTQPHEFNDAALDAAIGDKNPA